MTEVYATAPAVAFLNALNDAGMLEASSVGFRGLFNTDVFVVSLENDAAINNGKPTAFTVPLAKVQIVLGTPYGKRRTYMNVETDEDWFLSMRTRIYGNTGADVQDAQTRMQFSTMYRQAIYGQYSIYEVGIDEHPRMRPYDHSLGFALMDYTIRYRYMPDD